MELYCRKNSVCRVFFSVLFFFQSGKPDASYRLRCVLAAAVDTVQKELVSYNESGNLRLSGDDSRALSVGGGGVQAMVEKQAEQVDRMCRKVMEVATRVLELLCTYMQ